MEWVWSNSAYSANRQRTKDGGGEVCFDALGAKASSGVDVSLVPGEKSFLLCCGDTLVSILEFSV
jgi:hypothetical protein